MAAMPPLRVVIADDHDLLRSGLRLQLERIRELQVVGEAADGEELLQLLHREPADLVICDVAMKGVDGLTALKHIRRRHPEVKVIILSMHASAGVMRRAYALGASAYALKEEPPEDIERTIRTVMSGRVHYSPLVARTLESSQEKLPEKVLTARQIEVLVMLGRGLAGKEAAFALGLSPKTVNVHRANIMARLGITDPVGLALYCVRHGLVDPARDG